MGSARDMELMRRGVPEMGVSRDRSSGDRDLTRCGVQQMGRSRDGELRR